MAKVVGIDLGTTKHHHHVNCAGNPHAWMTSENTFHILNSYKRCQQLNLNDLSLLQKNC
jgi:hypothetical protein